MEKLESLLWLGPSLAIQFIVGIVIMGCAPAALELAITVS